MNYFYLLSYEDAEFARKKDVQLKVLKMM